MPQIAQPEKLTSEVAPDFSRFFVEFVDPDNENQIVRADLTWLTSNWGCIFATGCPGISTDCPAAGCCLLGAHFCEAADEERVAETVAQLTAEEWQFKDLAAEIGWVEDVEEDWVEEDEEEVDSSDTADSDSSEDRDAAAADDTAEDEETVEDEVYQRKTVVVDGACIFLNRSGFPGGVGCALHLWAVKNKVPPHTIKPDVCWQLPLRRTYRWVERADGTEYLEISIGEYTRADWGPGGHEFDWYCTGSPLSHQNAQPVWKSQKAELIEMIGKPAYKELDRLCKKFLKSKLPRHPATEYLNN